MKGKKKNNFTKKNYYKPLLRKLEEAKCGGTVHYENSNWMQRIISKIQFIGYFLTVVIGLEVLFDFEIDDLFVSLLVKGTFAVFVGINGVIIWVESTKNESIKEKAKHHNKIADKYNKLAGEINNFIERPHNQTAVDAELIRINDVLVKIRKNTTYSEKPKSWEKKSKSIRKKYYKRYGEYEP